MTFQEALEEKRKASDRLAENPCVRGVGVGFEKDGALCVRLLVDAKVSDAELKKIVGEVDAPVQVVKTGEPRFEESR